mmetsp:Transcript_43726/g.78497  ORF Transcript_43726/g.78497 Transcript_43726/m.78497 type:complete len:287 (-) Transcript_43726:2294-3154(-)
MCHSSGTDGRTSPHAHDHLAKSLCSHSRQIPCSLHSVVRPPWCDGPSWQIRIRRSLQPCPSHRSSTKDSPLKRRRPPASPNAELHISCLPRPLPCQHCPPGLVEQPSQLDRSAECPMLRGRRLGSFHRRRRQNPKKPPDSSRSGSACQNWEASPLAAASLEKACPPSTPQRSQVCCCLQPLSEVPVAVRMAARESVFSSAPSVAPLGHPPQCHVELHHPAQDQVRSPHQHMSDCPWRQGRRCQGSRLGRHLVQKAKPSPPLSRCLSRLPSLNLHSRHLQHFPGEQP